MVEGLYLNASRLHTIKNQYFTYFFPTTVTPWPPTLSFQQKYKEHIFSLFLASSVGFSPYFLPLQGAFTLHGPILPCGALLTFINSNKHKTFISKRFYGSFSYDST